MSRERLGVTVNGVQEICRWSRATPCPRHHFHAGNKDGFKSLQFVDLPDVEPAGVSLEDYNAEKRVPAGLEQLSEEERVFLKRYRFVEVDGVFYRLNNNGSSLDSFRMVNNIEDFTEDEFNQLVDYNFLTVDEVEYSIETDSSGFDRLEVLQKDVDAPYMRLNNWLVESAGLNVPEYVEVYGMQGQVLDYGLESAFMNGGCAVYALAFKELNPEYDIAVETFEDSEGTTYNHVFCIDPQTGESFDARGKFATPEKLYDYKDDPLTHVNPTMTGKASHEVWSLDHLQDFIADGFFTFDDTEEDLEIVKQLITGFDKRFK